MEKGKLKEWRGGASRGNEGAVKGWAKKISSEGVRRRGEGRGWVGGGERRPRQYCAENKCVSRADLEHKTRSPSAILRFCNSLAARIHWPSIEYRSCLSISKRCLVYPSLNTILSIHISMLSCLSISKYYLIYLSLNAISSIYLSMPSYLYIAFYPIYPLRPITLSVAGRPTFAPSTQLGLLLHKHPQPPQHLDSITNVSSLIAVASLTYEAPGVSSWTPYLYF